MASPASAQSYQRGYEETRRYNPPTYPTPPVVVVPAPPQVYYPPQNNWDGRYYSWNLQEWDRRQRQQLEAERRWRQLQQEELYYYQRPELRQRSRYWNGQGSPPHTTPTNRETLDCSGGSRSSYPLEAPEWGGGILNVPTCFNRLGNVSGFFYQGRWWRFLS